MPDFEFTSPEGKKYTISGPEGSTQEQAFGILQGQMGAQQPPAQSATSQEPAGFGYQQQIAQGMPIVGPLMNKASAAIGAAIQPLMGQGGDKSFGERYSGNLQSQEAQDAAFAASHPIGSTAANLVGGGMALGPVSQTAIGAKALGMAPGWLGLGQGVAGGAALGGTDAALRGENPAQGAALGAALTGGARVVGNVGSRLASGVKGFVQPFTQAGREAKAGEILAGAAEGGPTAAAQGAVAGSEPTLAQATGNPGIAQIERTLRDTGGPIGQQFVRRNEEQALARNAAFGNVSGDPLSLESLRNARSAAADQAVGPGGSVWQNKTEANPQGVVQVIDNILASPSGQRDAVQSALNNIRSKLVLDNPIEDRIARANDIINAGIKSGSQVTTPIFKQARQLIRQARNGDIDESTLTNQLQRLAGTQKIVGPVDNALNVIKEGPTKLQTDPEQLYGIRKAASDLMSFANPQTKLAASELGSVKEALDRSIEKGAPGFTQYLSDYASASKPIDVQSLLQKANITDATGGNVTLQKVDSAIKNIERMQTQPGANAAKSFSDTEMDQLRSLRDDLRMGANVGKGKAVGSNTFQNLAAGQQLGKLLAGRLGSGASGAAVGYLGDLSQGNYVPNIGTLAGMAAGGAVRNRYAAANEDILKRLAEKLLNPQSGVSSIQAAQLAQALRNQPGLLSRAPIGAIGYGGFGQRLLASPSSNPSP